MELGLQPVITTGYRGHFCVPYCQSQGPGFTPVRKRPQKRHQSSQSSGWSAIAQEPNLRAPSHPAAHCQSPAWRRFESSSPHLASPPPTSEGSRRSSRGLCQMRVSTAGRGSRPPVDNVTRLLTFCSAFTMPRLTHYSTRSKPSSATQIPGRLSPRELRELEQEKRQQLQDPVLMPLPGHRGRWVWDQGPTWIDTCITSPAQDRTPPIQPYMCFHRETPACLMGKVIQLESMVKALQEDLKKEKDAKASLQAQIQSLREDNQRLLEESYSASAKLKKFTEWVFNTIDMN
ncbi:signal-induced proliferation-associated 1-like protein 1 [Lates japonicus]|uniref:Signal-induced proliferation-associated 1-like protein 1 n=1 Tax=Lates japonicus TaxID=270547 RepID=A0AAD3NJN5_LATJO|nr:signal-induced proliferation-associated 1-like protein 1 [Lates japonicus]